MFHPCKDCQDRRGGCHALCERYKKQIEELHQLKEKRALDRKFKDSERLQAVYNSRKNF